MRAEQREVREIVIESDALLPRALVVALRALPAFVAAVHVVVSVAGHAVAGQRDVVDGLLVAGLALEQPMRAAQRITGIPVVIESDLGPFDDRMAALALRTVVTLVLVIFAMAAVAVARQLVVEGIARVAALACQSGVRALERKLGVAMVEGRSLPVVDRMTLLTTRAVPALVHVILLVAAVAVARRAPERLIGVTVEAGGGSVLAEQAELRLVVIERRILPGALVVTVGADAAELPLVDVVVTMAVDAGARCLTELLSTRMAV